MSAHEPKKIAIIGAGITGLCAAYEAMRSERNISSIDIFDPKGFPANNASAMAGGMLAPYSEIEHMNEDWIEAGIKGIEFWRNCDAPSDFVQKGSLILAHKEDDYILQRFRKHLPQDKQNLVDINALEPALNNRFTEALYLEEEAHLTPALALDELCTMLERSQKCTLIIETANVTALKSKYDYVLDCRGMGAAEDSALRGVKGETLIVRNPDLTLSRPIRLMHPRYPLYIVPRKDNIFMIGATQIESEGENGISLRSAMELMSALYSLHPSFADAEIIETKTGIRPAYPNNLPKIKIKDNVIACNGLFRHGFLLGPVIAEAAIDTINDKPNKFIELLTAA